ncbi:MAG TPA: undecaprenyl-diphosphatase UppP [bacterium]|nr:undecaprenyl-diphosphatase UppP [bacterium]
MEYLLAVIAGLIQGLTEFIPVSSSGHLVIFHDIFKLNFSDDLLFDVALHLGTFVALVAFFFRDIEKIIRGFLSSLTNWNPSNNFNQRLAWLVIIGIIPAVIFGYFFEGLIIDYFRSGYLVAAMLIAVALLFWLLEKYATKTKDLQTMTAKDSLIIGLAQVLAFIPGTSRSGITIIAGLSRKLKREAATRFSFLMSIPVVLGAGLKTLLDVDNWNDINVAILLVGGLSAATFGYLAIKYFLKYISHHSLNIFAWYRLIIGCLILIWLMFF